MKNSIIIELLQNTAILLSFAMLYENFWIRNEKSKSIRIQVIIGLVLSGIGVVLMFMPWSWAPGIVFDTRSVMISISGLFFGPIPTIITMTITSMVRLIIGGDGQWMGVAVIISSGTIGLLWRKYRPEWKTKNYYLELLAMGVIVHILMSLCTLLLPPDKILPTLKTIAIPLIVIYPPATMLLGLIMLRQYNNWQSRLAQFKLKETERRLTQILESGNIISLILNKEGSINYCNNYLLQITGYTKDELIGKDWFTTFIPSDSRKEVFQIFTDSINAKNIVKNYESKILAISGEQLYLSWFNTVLFSDSDEIIGIASIGVNITDSKIYENKLLEINEEYKQINRKLQEAKEKAEESDRLKTAFLANMSHEIRTPMNGILGFTQILQQTGVDNIKREHYLEVINSSCDRLLSVVNDIIDISKIESGIIDLHYSNVNINNLLSELDNFFTETCRKKKLSLVIQSQLASNTNLCSTDETKLQQILSNLLSNSVKFTNEGEISLTCLLKNNMLEFIIEDTGIGIDDKNQVVIFELFRQADENYTREYGGTGLGLAIAKAYINKLGGKIRLESTKGKGTSVYFTIPFIPSTRSEIPEKKSEITGDLDWSDKKILIAEDEDTNFEFIAEALKSTRITIYHARNGQEAIILFEKNNPNLILMDIRMPKLNGYEATKKIRQKNKFIPIIALTAYAIDTDKEKIMNSGLSDYITKPVPIDKLLDLLKHYLESSNN